MILRLLVLRDSLLSWPSANIHSSAFEVVLFVFVSSKRELLACLLCPSHALREEKSGARTKQHRVNMAGAPGGPYSGTSTLALVARITAVSVGVIYGSMKLAYLKASAPKQPSKH